MNRTKLISDKELPTTEKIPVIALVGMPNSGKTTLFNALTGANYKTSNYPGSTVEYSSGKLKSNYALQAEIFDTPGIISLNPSSIDEQIAIEGLFNHPRFGTPDAVIVTCDVTQLSRQLFLVKQLLDCGFRIVVALTMNDLLRKKELSVNSESLESILGCRVVKINASSKTGLDELISSLHWELNLKPDRRIHKPVTPTEEEIASIYDFTEETEIEVLESASNKLDIDELNRKLFRNLHREPDNKTLKLDSYFLHPLLGSVIFIISMGLIFTSIFWIAQPLMDLVDNLFSFLSEAASSVLPKDIWYSDLISEGIITGLGSVMVFVPQILILFVLLGLLEDTGYLARAAMLVDKPLSKLGLNGRSFIPMLSGYACAIPAIMASRTIANRRERLLTIMIIPLMSCSARLPVYALLLAYLTPPGKPWIPGLALGGLYLFSLIVSISVAGIINKFRKKEDKSTFMLELPPYRLPIVKNVLKSSYYKATMYIKQAGPVIIVISLILWAITYFPADVTQQTNPDIKHQINAKSERLNNSYAATIGRTILEPILKPLGWDWRVGISLISAFAAREVFVSAMAITFSITENMEEDQKFQGFILNSMREARTPEDLPLFTTASVISLIVYFMFAMQCLSTVAVSRKETGSWKIPAIQILLYSAMAYVSAFLAYNGLKLIGIN